MLIKKETVITGTLVKAVRGVSYKQGLTPVRVSLEVDYKGETLDSLLPRAFASDLIAWQGRIRGADSERAMVKELESLRGPEGRIVLSSTDFTRPKVVTRATDPSNLDTATLLAALRAKAERGDPAAMLAISALEG